MSTDAQREAVARVLEQTPMLQFGTADYLKAADEIIAAYEAAVPEDLRPTLICRTCGLAAIVEPTKDPAP